MSDTPPEPHFDQYGRGPLLRAYQERHGDTPFLPGPGVASMLFAVRDSVDRAARSFPEQFKSMLVRAVGEVIDKVLPKMMEATIAQEVTRQVNEKMEAVRTAYSDLKARVDAIERKAGGGTLPSTPVQSRRLAVVGR